MRRDYLRGRLDESGSGSDPLPLFASWLEEAVTAGQLEPTAMTLATADSAGRVSARMVLLKGHGPEGLVFYSNEGSRKGRDLHENPRAALVFWWDLLERQVRVEGSVEQLGAAESEAYFASRPRGSQLAAWASQQSAPLTSREELEGSYREFERRFEGQPVPKPGHWGGYRLLPDAFEFWQGRGDRLHDRFRFELEGAGWRRTRLAP